MPGEALSHPDAATAGILPCFPSAPAGVVGLASRDDVRHRLFEQFHQLPHPHRDPRAERRQRVLDPSGMAVTTSRVTSPITDVTDTKVAYRDVTPEELTAVLRGSGVDDGTAGFVVALE